MADNNELLIRIRADVKQALDQLNKTRNELEATGNSGREAGAGLDATGRGARDAEKEIDRIARTNASATEEINRIVGSLEHQNATFGKSKEAADLYRLELLGATDAQKRYAETLAAGIAGQKASEQSRRESAAAADREAAAARRAAESEQAFVEQLRGRLDPARQYRQELRQLDAAYSKGLVSQAEYRRGTKLLNTQMKNAGRQANRTSNFIVGLGTSFAAFYGASKLVELTHSLLDANREQQRIVYTLQSVTGSAAGANAEFEHLTELSDELGLDLKETAKGYSRIAVSAKSAGIANQALRTDFRGLAETFTVLHTPAEEVNGLLVQLEQGLSLGKFQMQDFRAIAQHLPGTMDLASQAVENMGGNLQDMLANGGVPAKQFFTEFTRLLHEKYGPEAKEAAHGINAELNRLHTTIFGLETDSSGFMDSASNSVRNFNETLHDPAVRQGLESLITLLGKAASGATEAAASFGNFASSVQLDASNLGKALPSLEDIDRYIQRLQRMRNGSAMGRIGLIKGAGLDMYMSDADIDKAVAELEDERDKIIKRANDTSSDLRRLKILPDLNGSSQNSLTPLIFRPGGNKSDTTLPSVPDTKAISARLDAQVKLTKEKLQEQQAALDAAHQRGLVSIQNYYSQRARLQQRSIDAEIAAKRQELAAEKSSDDKNAAAKQAKIIGEINVLQERRAAIAQKAARDETAAEKKLADQLDQVRAKLLNDQGKTAQAASIRIQQQYEQLLRRLKSEGNDAGIQLVNNLINVEQAKSRLEELRQEYERVLGTFKTQEQTIKAQVKAGQMTEAEGQKKINQLYKDAAADLDPLLAKMQQLAESTGNEQTIASVKKLRAQLKLTGTQAQRSFDDLNQYAVQAARNIQSTLADFLFDPFDQGLSGMVSGFATALQHMAANAAAAQIGNKLFGSSFGSSGELGGLIGKGASLLGSYFGGGGAAASEASAIASIFHDGGDVHGGHPVRRSVPLAAFVGAPRFHSGIDSVGLKPDEVPAILQTGERVLSRGQVAAQKAQGQSGGGTHVSFGNFVFQDSGLDEDQARQASDGMRRRMQKVAQEEIAKAKRPRGQLSGAGA